MVRIFIYILIIASLISCEKEINWTVDNQDIDYLIVESIITNEDKHQVVKLSNPSKDINYKFIPVSDALVSVTINDSVYNFIEDINNLGNYISKVKFIAIIESMYYLNIEIKEEKYFAESNILSATPFEPLVYQPISDNSNLYKISFIAPEYDQNEEAMYEICIDWTHLVGSSLTDTITQAKLFHYTLKTVDVSQIFSPEIEEVHFPKGSIIIEKKYSVTEKYGEFLRSMLAEKNWKGSFFDEAPGNLVSNISNNAKGFFTASTIITDTIIVH